MDYRISYDPPGKDQHRREDTFWRIQGYALVFLILFCVTVHFFWPEGRVRLLDLLFYGQGQETAALFDAMVQNIRAGEGPGEAVTAFCRSWIGISRGLG